MIKFNGFRYLFYVLTIQMEIDKFILQINKILHLNSLNKVTWAFHTSCNKGYERYGSETKYKVIHIHICIRICLSINLNKIRSLNLI